MTTALAAERLHWIAANGQAQQGRWLSSAGYPPPRRVTPVDDQISADAAWALMSQGTALLWQGDYHNARQLLQAVQRRLQRQPQKPGTSLTETFHRYRLAQAQRARSLGLLLLPLEPAPPGYRVALRRAPEVAAACHEVFGAPSAENPTEVGVLALRDLLGLIGAHEWRRQGVAVPALGPGVNIHPHHGVFAPVRGEYLDLVAAAPLPQAAIDHGSAADIGTGTGVLAALLVQRGLRQVIATDNNPRALACAADNLQRLGLTAQVRLEATDLFPEGKVALLVCNPPWLPGKPASGLETAIYDQDSRMLRGFLAGAAAHLLPGGEAWLILSDLAEHLGLRRREELLDWIAAADLKVHACNEIRPRHSRAQDPSDPLHLARVAERTALWQLRIAQA